VVTSTVKSDHKAVIAYTGPRLKPINKSRERHVFRRRSPTQHALFLEHAAQLNMQLANDAWGPIHNDKFCEFIYDMS